jgi:hypothetical protein
VQKREATFLRHLNDPEAMACRSKNRLCGAILDASMMRRILALLTKYSSARRFLSNSDIFRRNGVNVTINIFGHFRQF